MRCLLIHQSFASPRDGGGTRHFEFARQCVLRGDDFIVVTSDVSYLEGKKRIVPSDESIDGVRVIRVRSPAVLHKSFGYRILAYLSFMWKSFWCGWRHSRDADVILGTSPPLFQALAASTLATLRRKKFLLEIRDLWPEFAIDMGVLKSRIAIFLARRLENHLYRRAERIVVNSPAYADYLEQKGVDVEKISLIANGVDPDMFDARARGDSFRSQLGVESRFLISYAGAIGPANDIATILRTAQLVQNDAQIHFVLAGDGKAREEMESLATQLGLTNVSFIGIRPKKEIAELLAASSACIATLLNIPMFKKTYPNKVFDYMAAGRPTLLGIDGVIRKVVENAEGGVFFEPGNPEALAAAVRRLKDHPGMTKEMGRKAREFVARHFNRKTQAIQFHGLLAELADEPGKSLLNKKPMNILEKGQ